MKFARVLLFIGTAGFGLANQAINPLASGFANACAGDQYFGSLANPGDGFSTTNDAYLSCQTTYGGNTFASASNSGVSFGHPYSNSATANAGVGFIKVGATNTGSQS